MHIATWNVNSLNVRLPHVLAWLEKHPVDVLALQETKLSDDRFPATAIAEAGYRCVYAGQKTYNGVALLSRAAASDVADALPDFADSHRRVIAATIGGVRVVSVYCPNGAALDSPKFEYKIDWFGALARWLVAERQRHEALVVTGDFNVAPRPQDTCDPDRWEGNILCSAAEREALARVLAIGLTDCWRLFDDRQGRHRFTWWDYRGGGWARNAGLRIDHVLASAPLADNCRHCEAHVGERGRKRPSDHVPVVAEFDI